MGVRSLEYSVARRGYFVVAGPAGPDAERPEFELFLWDGTSDRPEPIAGLRDRITAAGIAKFQPEALAVDASGTRLLILSDDDVSGGENPRINGDESVTPDNRTGTGDVGAPVIGLTKWR